MAKLLRAVPDLSPPRVAVPALINKKHVKTNTYKNTVVSMCKARNEIVWVRLIPLVDLHCRSDDYSASQLQEQFPTGGQPC